MSLTVPHHELLEVLRDGEDRLVYRTRHQGIATVTRIILRPVPVELAGLIEGVVTSGVGSLAGMDEEIIATLEGYRVRSRLSGPGLPRVCAAGLAADPTRCTPPFGLPFITTRWMPGHTLRAAALPMLQRPGILRGVLSVLAGIHEADVAYGDLKPQNIVLGPDGVGLIDLDTLRQVPAAHLPIRVTHRTPRYAAPEQEGDHPLLYLASDIYTFGLLVCELLGESRPGEAGFPPRLASPWGAVVEGCLRSRPLDRPTAPTLLAHLDSPVDTLPIWSGAPFSPLTERVTASPPAQQTILVEDPAEQTARVAEPVEPVPPPVVESTIRVPEPARPGRPRGLILLGGLLGMIAISAVRGGGRWAPAPTPARQDAAATAQRLMEALKEHKTVAARNNLTVLGGIRDEAAAALDELETADLLGLYALTTVWSQKWHYASASWDATRYAEGEAAVQRALAAGSSTTGYLAAGVLAGGACRLMPDSEATPRRSRCTESLENIDRAWQAVRWDDSMSWLAVEVQWAGVMSGGALARHLETRGDAEGARSVRKDAMVRCESARTRLAAAPVNGEELVESCLAIAGPAERFTEYLEWSAWLIGNELETDGAVSSSTKALIFESVHPDCHGMSYYRSGIPQAPSTRGGWLDLCRYVGMVALGCPDHAEEMRDCLRESWGLREQRCVVYNQQDGVPWRAALSATASPLLSSCAL